VQAVICGRELHNIVYVCMASVLGEGEGEVGELPKTKTKLAKEKAKKCPSLHYTFLLLIQQDSAFILPDIWSRTVEN